MIICATSSGRRRRLIVSKRGPISIYLYLCLSIYLRHCSACSLCQEITGQSPGRDGAENFPSLLPAGATCDQSGPNGRIATGVSAIRSSEMTLAVRDGGRRPRGL